MSAKSSQLLVELFLFVVFVVVVIFVIVVPLDADQALEQGDDLFAGELELVVRLELALQDLEEAAIEGALFFHVGDDVVQTVLFRLQLELLKQEGDELLDGRFSDGFDEVVEFFDEFFADSAWELHALPLCERRCGSRGARGFQAHLRNKPSAVLERPPDLGLDSGMFTPELIQALPKTDLHCHLDGSLRLSTLIDLSKQHKLTLPSYTEEGLREQVFKETYRDLPDYLHGFGYTSAVLCDAESIERVSYELGQDCLAEGVRYLEVRFAPQLHVRPGFDVKEVLKAVDRGLDRARREHEASPAVKERGEPPFRYGIIACAMRMFTGGFGPYFKNLLSVMDKFPVKEVYGTASLALARAVVEARDDLGLPVVGFDLAGAEAGHPASDHMRAYNYAHTHFLKKTVHAGEAYGPESIFQAITKLHADRIGHGTHLYGADQVQGDDDPHRYVRKLSEYIADRRILLEVCITSNMQTMPELRRVKDHPFGRMVSERLSVSLCTDNRLISRTTVSRELEQAVEAFDLTPATVRNVILHGFKRSFFPGSYREKREYVRKVIDYYDAVAAKHGLPHVARGQA